MLASASPRSSPPPTTGRSLERTSVLKFQAIDRLLDAEDRAALRKLSTRARITADRFTNTYNWGDFQGDPAKLMDRWFDLHLYLANWGTHRLMIRFPRQTLDISRLDAFLRAADEFASLKVAEDHVVLDIRRKEQEDQFDRDDRSWLASLVPLRAAVMSGDLRLFYMIWLMRVEDELLDDGAEEPLPGIGPLTPALDAFATFFGIDADLVAAAAERSPATWPSL